MAIEPDVPPQPNTFRFMLWKTVQSLQYLRNYWGRRLLGGAIGLISDALAEGSSQAFYARLPGHPQQARDSLEQSGKDRDLYRFRGESDAAFSLRQRQVWEDSAQAGTAIQMLKVLNQWGFAGWPSTWDPANLTIVESGNPLVWTFTVTIVAGSIVPPWIPEVYGGSGLVYGQPDLYYGLGASTDINMLLYLVKKWKRSASKVFLTVFYDGSNSITFTVG